MQLSLPPPLWYRTAAKYPKKKEPIGIFETMTLWFTAKFSAPKSSGVADTAMDVMAPEHAPIIAAPMYKERVLDSRRRRKAPAIGAIMVAMNAGLDIIYPFLHEHENEN